MRFLNRLMEKLFQEDTLEAEGRLANDGDFQRAGLFKKGGIYLGRTANWFCSRKLYYPRAGSIVAIGQQESGKTTSLIIPILLTYKRGSVIVTDPKGLLLPQTMRHRRDTLDNEIIVLSPWASELKAEFGYDIPDTGYNPLSILHFDDPALFENAALLATLLIPVPPTAGENTFFLKSAQGIVTGLLLLLTARTHHQSQKALGHPVQQFHRPTLAELNELAHNTPQEWRALADEMDRAFQTYGLDLRIFSRKITEVIDADRQWAGISNTMTNALDIYSKRNALGRHTSIDGFNPADLKRCNMTVYIVCPQGRQDANKAWMSLVMAMCAEAVSRGKQAPVLLLMEEFANLGYINLSKYIAQNREAGLQAHLTIQSLPLLQETYGPNGLAALFSLCAIKQFLLIDDYRMAEEISRVTGKYEHVTYDSQGNPRSSHWRDKVRPDQLTRLKSHEQIILASGPMPPALIWRRPYYEDPIWNWQTDVNPMIGIPKGKKPLRLVLREKLREKLPAWMFRWPFLAGVGTAAALGIAVQPYPANSTIGLMIAIPLTAWFLYCVRPDFAPWNWPGFKDADETSVQDESESTMPAWVELLLWGVVILIVVKVFGN